MNNRALPSGRGRGPRLEAAAIALVVMLVTIPAHAGTGADDPKNNTDDCTDNLLECGWTGPEKGVDWSPALRSASSEKPYWRKNFFKRVLVDQKFLVTKWFPSEVRNPGFIVPFGSAVFVAASSSPGPRSLDDRVELYVSRWIREPATAPAELLSNFGDADTTVVIVGTTYLIARLTHNDHLSETTSLMAEALISSAIWSTALKRLTSRARPGDAPSSRLLNDPSGNYRSFPSGHATGAFAVAAIISGQYRDRKWVSWVAYGSASLIAASRVALGRHYVSDVVAGAALGHSIGRMVLVRAHGEEAGWAKAQRWSPIVDPMTESYGVAYSRSW